MKALKRFSAALTAAIMTLLIFTVCAPKTFAASVSVDTGTYYIVNEKSGMYLSIPSNKDADGVLLRVTTPAVDQVRQVMKIKKNTASGGHYIIQPAQSTTRALNIDGLLPASGSSVSLQPISPSLSEDWVFDQQADGTYIIRSGYNSSLVLTAMGEKSTSAVKAASYVSGNSLQRWKLVPFTLAKSGDDSNIKSYGIDVSKWQGDIDWKAVAEYGVEFAIIRIGYSGAGEKDGGLDEKFYQNYDGAKSNGILVGTYIYSYATTVKEARADAEQVLSQLDGRALDYPIYFDIEDPDYQAKLSRRLKTDMCLEFMKTIHESKYNYKAGVYASQSWFDTGLYADEIKSAGSGWLAKWPASSQPDEQHGDYDLWQYRSDGKVAGISGGTGNVDMNVSYINTGSYIFTGSPITPNFTVFSPFDGTLLTKDVDYKITYGNNVNVGTATATVTGIGNYAGKLTAVHNFKITKRPLSSVSINTLSQRTYTGKAIEPSVKAVLGNYTLKKNRDFTVTYKNNVNVGTATATVKGRGNFSGSVKLTFNIKKKSVKYADIVGLKDMTYTGKKRTLTSLKVKTSAATLKKNTDYTVTYKNNTDFGTAKVTIKGIGDNCYGSITKTFSIVPKKPKTLKASNVTKTKVTLTWSHVDYATRYQLYRATSKNGKYTRIYSTSDRWQYTYTDKGLKEGTYYYYKVRAYKTVDGKKYYGAWSDVKVVNTKISDTEFTLKGNKSKGTISVNIKKDKSVTGYIVYMYKSKSKSYEKVWAGKDLQFVKSGLKKGKTYYFKIRTYKKTPDGTIYGKKSEPQKLKL